MRRITSWVLLLLLAIPAAAQELPKPTEAGQKALDDLIGRCIALGGLKTSRGLQEPGPIRLTVADAAKLKAAVGADKARANPRVARRPGRPVGRSVRGSEAGRRRPAAGHGRGGRRQSRPGLRRLLRGQARGGKGARIVPSLVHRSSPAVCRRSRAGLASPTATTTSRSSTPARASTPRRWRNSKRRWRFGVRCTASATPTSPPATTTSRRSTATRASTPRRWRATRRRWRSGVRCTASATPTSPSATTTSRVSTAARASTPRRMGSHQKALEIRRAVYGERHPDVAQSYNNIALVYASQGEYAKALEEFQKALGDLACGVRRAPPRRRHQLQQHRARLLQPGRVRQGAGGPPEGAGDLACGARRAPPWRRHKLPQHRGGLPQPGRVRQGAGGPPEGAWGSGVRCTASAIPTSP